MRHAFKTFQWAPYPIEKVFAFFSNPDNLPKLMPEWQKASIDHSSIVAPPAGESPNPQAPLKAAGAGSAITMSFRPFPLSPFRMTWVASIVEFQWNDHFCDEQPKGPFAYWRHCHRVSEEKRGGKEGTGVVDDLTYELPLGILAEPAHALFVRGQIEEMFAYRQRRLLELLG